MTYVPHQSWIPQTWRRQDFKFSESQKEEYEMLLQARRERVKYFYANGLVAKSGAKRDTP